MSRVYRVVAIFGAAASLLINFGIVDLIDGLTGAFTDDTTRVLDAGWGVLFAVLIPVGLLASLRTVAGVQQIALITVAITVAAVALSPQRSAAVRFRPSWPLARSLSSPAASMPSEQRPRSGDTRPRVTRCRTGSTTAALAALAIAVALLALGPRLLALSASVAAALWAVACLLHPTADGSEGRGWAIAALGWAATLALTQGRRGRMPTRRRLLLRGHS